MEYMIGTNVKAKVEGDILTLTINLAETHGLSSTGKSIQIATTSGNVPLAGREMPVKVGLNVFSPK